MKKYALYEYNSCRDNPAVVKAKLLKFSNEVLDRAVDNLLKTCDKNKIIIEEHCNKILHLIPLNDCDSIDLETQLGELKFAIIKAREELGNIENFVDAEDIEKLSMLVALASESTKGFYRLSKIYLKVYQNKIDPVVTISVEYLNEPVVTMKSALINLQDDIDACCDEPDEDILYNTSDNFKYIEDYKELNSIAIVEGFELVRCSGDHGVFRNDKGHIVIIPQGRKIGKGLSIVIQKTICGRNTKVNKARQTYKI